MFNTPPCVPVFAALQTLQWLKNLGGIAEISKVNSKNVAHWLFKKMQEREDIEPMFFDVSNFDLPKNDYGTEIKDDFPEWREHP